AQRAGPSVAVVRWYEALFLNVSARLDQRGYLLHQAIGSSVHTGIPPHEFGLFWKLIGLAHGPVVLDAVIDLYQSLPASSLNQVEAALSAQQRGLLRRQALKAVSSLRLRDPFAALQLLDTEVRCQEAHRAAGKGEDNDLILQAVKNLIASIPFTPPGKTP